MSVLLAYDPEMAEYRFGRGHPMLPERFTLAVSLMDAWGLTAEPFANILRPTPADDALLLLAHAPEYVAFVRRLSSAPDSAVGHGIGPGDTPAFLNMHHAAALAVGATVEAVKSVLSRHYTRAMCPAGGLHHAHRERASGFCIYNDCAIAIEAATREHAGLRVAYVDIDVHHGDGVEAAFQDRADVLTLSVHESGKYLFPGTGRIEDVGYGPGHGFTINVPMPPYSGPRSYELVLSRVIAPALTAFAPDLIVLQAGADTHISDPLAHLQQTVAGYLAVVAGVVGLADTLSEGRIVVTGGGGYRPFTAVPRMWAGAMAVLEGRVVPVSVPEEWLEQARAGAVAQGTEARWDEHTYDREDAVDDASAETAMHETEAVIDRVRSVSPLLSGP